MSQRIYKTKITDLTIKVKFEHSEKIVVSKYAKMTWVFVAATLNTVTNEYSLMSTSFIK